jgi:hypothetical protein
MRPLIPGACHEASACVQVPLSAPADIQGKTIMHHTFRAAAAALLLALACAPAAAAAKDGQIVLRNASHWEIHELYVDESRNDEWGEDQLGDDVIGNGEEFTLTGIPCDKYDVRLVDEDGDECVLESVPLCGGSDEWTITDSDLLGCQAATEE